MIKRTAAIILIILQIVILTLGQRNIRQNSQSLMNDLRQGSVPKYNLYLKRNTRAKSELEIRLNAYLKNLATEQSFSGAVLVAKGNKILLEKGYGWADKQKSYPIKSSTKFYIASISKQFTASAILKLQEQGKLRVNDSIVEYLKDVPEDKKDITIHQLLTHTAGLKEMYAADGIVNRDEASNLLLKEPLKNKPGEQFGYTNDAYNLLAIIVEIVSGKPYEAFLREQLIKPAGMSQTGFWGEPVSTGDKSIAPILYGTLPAESKLPNWGFRGATGMFSTVGDLFRWQQSLFANKILTKTSTEKLLSPYTQTSRGMYTYGWFVTRTEKIGKEIWTAGSEDFGHNSIIKTYPDGTVIIVVSNAGKLADVLARDVVSRGLEDIIFNK